MDHSYPVGKGRNALSKDMGNIQEKASQCIEKRERSIWSKILPDKLDKENFKHLSELARIEHGYREKALQIVKNAQVQCIEEMYNDYLVRGKIKIRGQRAEAVLEQKNILEEKIMMLSNQFEDKLEQEVVRAERQKNPMLRERKILMIEETIESYFDLIRELQYQFQNILNESVKE